MTTAIIALTGLLLSMNPVDPQTIHRTAPRAQFALSGYDFTASQKSTRLPYARLGGDTIEVHFAFTAPFTGRCEIFELVTTNGIRGVAYPWGSGDGRPAIKGHTIHVDLALHTGADLRANGMKREKPTIGMDCWKTHGDDHVVFSSLYELTQQMPG